MLPLILAGASIASTIIGGRKQEKAAKNQAAALAAEGRAVKVSKYFTAKQLEAAAGQQQSAGQRNAQEEIRKSELMQSKALAIAGASGGSAADPDILSITSQLAREGQLAADMQLYEGDEAARGMKLDAAVSRWEGDRAAEGASITAKSVRDSVSGIRLNTILSAAKSAASWGSSSSGKDVIAKVK